MTYCDLYWYNTNTPFIPISNFEKSVSLRKIVAIKKHCKFKKSQCLPEFDKTNNL